VQATGLLYSPAAGPQILRLAQRLLRSVGFTLYVLAASTSNAGIPCELVRAGRPRPPSPGTRRRTRTKALAAPKHELQRKLLDGLRYLLKEEFKLNRPRPSDGWLTRTRLWLVSKTVPTSCGAICYRRAIDGIPAANTAVFNVLQDHGIALASRRQGDLGKPGPRAMPAGRQQLHLSENCPPR